MLVVLCNQGSTISSIFQMNQLFCLLNKYYVRQYFDYYTK